MLPDKYLRVRERFHTVLEEEGLTVGETIKCLSIFLFSVAISNSDSLTEARAILKHYLDTNMKTLEDPDTEELFQHINHQQKKNER